eukprot:jgi/Mesen1/817/ME000111S10963
MATQGNPLGGGGGGGGAPLSSMLMAGGTSPQNLMEALGLLQQKIGALQTLVPLIAQRFMHEPEAFVSSRSESHAHPRAEEAPAPRWRSSRRQQRQVSRP